MILSPISHYLSFFKHYLIKILFNLRPTLRINSEKLKKMGLKLGENKIVYYVESEFQGKQVLQGKIFLWDYQDLKIVFSDIDGTITK